MEPRAEKIRRKRMEKRKKLFKAFSASTAVSSMLLGGAQLASPTYAQFNSSQETELQIGACFIFPKVIEEDYRDESVLISEEAILKAKAAIAAGEQLQVIDTAISQSLHESMDDGSTAVFKTADAGGGAGDNVLAAQKDSLKSQLNNAKSQLIAVNSKIQEIQKEYQKLETHSQSIMSYLNNELKDTQAEGKQKLSEINDLVVGINGIIDPAINECRYEQSYFTEVLTPMNKAAMDLEDVLKELEDEEIRFKHLLEKYEVNLKSYKNSLESYRVESTRLESEINSIQNNIDKIKGQIKEEEAKAKDEKEKKNQQSATAEKPKNNGKPADQNQAPKPEEPKADPSAEGGKETPPAGEQKDNASDKPADSGTASDSQPDAGTDSNTGAAQDSGTDAGITEDPADSAQ